MQRHFLQLNWTKSEFVPRGPKNDRLLYLGAYVLWAVRTTAGDGGTWRSNARPVSDRRRRRNRCLSRSPRRPWPTRRRRTTGRTAVGPDARLSLRADGTGCRGVADRTTVLSTVSLRNVNDSNGRRTFRAAFRDIMLPTVAAASTGRDPPSRTRARVGACARGWVRAARVRTCWTRQPLSDRGCNERVSDEPNGFSKWSTSISTFTCRPALSDDMPLQRTS